MCIRTYKFTVNKLEPGAAPNRNLCRRVTQLINLAASNVYMIRPVFMFMLCLCAVKQ